MSSASTQPSAMKATVTMRDHSLASVTEDGILTGIIGAFLVALWFLIFDFARGQPFFTPSLIGSVIFLGVDVEAVTTVDYTMVFAYTGIHGFLFLFAGMIVAWMFVQFERNPQFGMVLLLLFLLFEFVLFGFEVTIVPNLVGALGAWAVALANLLSAFGMFWFLLRRHPEAWEQLRKAGE